MKDILMFAFGFSIFWFTLGVGLWVFPLYFGIQCLKENVLFNLVDYGLKLHQWKCNNNCGPIESVLWMTFFPLSPIVAIIAGIMMVKLGY